MKRIEQRLALLEQRQRGTRGLRCFEQDQNNPDLYRDLDGFTYSDAETEELAAAGYQVIKIVYHVDPDDKDVIRLRWGDPDEL
jgi:hypothetical protein